MPGAPRTVEQREIMDVGTMQNKEQRNWVQWEIGHTNRENEGARGYQENQVGVLQIQTWFQQWSIVFSCLLVLCFCLQLLRYNSHAMQYIHFNCTIFFAYLQIGRPIPTVNFETFSSSQKETLYPSVITPLYPHP